MQYFKLQREASHAETEVTQAAAMKRNGTLLS